MLVELLPYIDADEPIPFALMLRSFNEGSAILADAAARQAANEILAGAGDYLRMYEIPAFIQAEISDADATALIEKRKLFIERARHLVPTILRLLGPRLEREIESALMQVEDCCYDFPLIKATEHPKKITRRRRDDLISLKHHIDEIISISGKVNGTWDLEYTEHKYLLVNDSNPNIPPLRDSDQLIVELKIAKFCIDMALLKHDKGVSPLYSGDNKAHTHIVDCAYSLSRQFGKLAFVTTPGSDFSLLCGLILELATGRPDESLAGAINRFSRSNVRREIDEHNATTNFQNSAEYISQREADNVANVREKIENCIKDFDYWRDLKVSMNWSEFELIQIFYREVQVGEEALSLSNSYGPHLVWAIPHKKYDPFSTEFAEARAQALMRGMELGRARRSQKSN